uniref:Piwi domain-containing protein n=1 Tax=Elaeophora elaphi TaxID=1147741 RepID=A0A158Q754_9BILA
MLENDRPKTSGSAKPFWLLVMHRDIICSNKLYRLSLHSQADVEVVMSTISGAIRGRARGRGVRRGNQSETSSVGGADMSSITSSLSSMDISSQESIIGPKRNTLPIITCLLQRFDYGKVGTKIPLNTNYYEIKISRDVYVHRYEVIIKDCIKNRLLDRDICRSQFWKIVSNDLNLFGKLENLVYNDVNCLWAKEKLNLSNGVGRKEIVTTTSHGDQRVAYIMELKYLSSFLVSLTMEYDDSSNAIVQFLNALLTQNVRCPLSSISNHYYPYGNSVYIIPNQNDRWVIPVGGGIDGWTGLHGVAKIDSTGRALFNADVSTCAFFKIRISLIDFFLEVLNEFRGRRPSKYTVNELRQANKIAMNDSQRKSLKRALTGVSLRLTYGPERNKLKDYKFVDVGQPACIVRFLHKNPNDLDDMGIEVTVEEYFAQYKEIRLNFPHLPVIQIGPPKKKIFVPMELLIIADKPQKVKRELTDFQQAKLIRGAIMEPNIRKERISSIIAHQKHYNDIFLQNFGVWVSPNMIRLNGRVLDPPKLELNASVFSHPLQISNSGEVSCVEVDKGKWPLRNMFAKSPTNVLFGVICVDRAIDINDFWGSYRNLIKACSLFGMKFLVTDPLLAEWEGDERENLRHVVRGMINECNIRILHCSGIIKTVCDLEEGIACQVILAKTFHTMSSSRPETCSTAHNIILKMNTKLGGVNNKVHQDYNIWPKFSNGNDPTIFIGVDVIHPRPGKLGNSIASVVGSINLDATRYEASIKVQHPKMERIVYLVDALRERLVAFCKSVGMAPKHIIIYRYHFEPFLLNLLPLDTLAVFSDGMAESEFLNTLKEELTLVKTACKKLDPEYAPTLAYVVVQKRHHTRFFVEPTVNANFQNIGTSRGNIPPGTVVDTCVTSSRLFDFFLCSHTSSIGTSRPSHYFVLYDSWNLTSDEWQHLTFALCHLYARCNQSVSIPAPVYYAHLACSRAGVHNDILLVFTFLS